MSKVKVLLVFSEEGCCSEYMVEKEVVKEIEENWKNENRDEVDFDLIEKIGCEGYVNRNKFGGDMEEIYEGLNSREEMDKREMEMVDYIYEEVVEKENWKRIWGDGYVEVYIK